MSRVAKLSEKELATVQECERNLGMVLVAYEKPPQIAKLTDEQLKTIREAENRLGTRLVAYT